MIPVIAFKLGTGALFLTGASMLGIASFRPDLLGIVHDMYIFGISEEVTDSNHKESEQIKLTGNDKNYKCKWGGKTTEFDCEIIEADIEETKKHTPKTKFIRDKSGTKIKKDALQAGNKIYKIKAWNKYLSEIKIKKLEIVKPWQKIKTI